MEISTSVARERVLQFRGLLGTSWWSNSIRQGHLTRRGLNARLPFPSCDPSIGPRILLTEETGLADHDRSGCGHPCTFSMLSLRTPAPPCQAQCVVLIIRPLRRQRIGVLGGVLQE